MMRLVVALGGNALLRRGEPATAGAQARAVEAAADGLAPLGRDHDLVVTHGNGPQVGLLALQAAALAGGGRAWPLDVLGAESEGMIGYVVERALAARLPRREIATLLTQTVVDPDDPAFARPTKPIGPLYPEAEARQAAAAMGWQIAPDGHGFRRVVASPEPLAIREIGVIRRLVEAHVIVVCAGGGGIPVAVSASGAVTGVEAVVDKDLATALLAREIDADALLILTDVAAAQVDWGRPSARPIRRAGPAALRALPFAAGTMAPKIEAACRFVEATGRPAVIGALGDAAALLAGGAGTRVVPGACPIELG